MLGTTDIYLQHIQSATTEAAMLELLAEEATELAHAALKVARIERGESPTPVNVEAAKANLSEEIADITAVFLAMDRPTETDLKITEAKIERWNDRLLEAHRKNGERTEERA